MCNSNVSCYQQPDARADGINCMRYKKYVCLYYKYLYIAYNTLEICMFISREEM